MKTYLLLVSLLVSLLELSKCYEIPNWNPGTPVTREDKIWPRNKYKFPYPIQSPVNIDLTKVKSRELSPLGIHFPFDNSNEMVSIENTGYYLEVLLPHDVEERPYINAGPLYNGRYIFEQLHFHWNHDNNCGSEHLFNGKCHSTEVHCVFYYEIYGSFEEASNHPDGVAVLTLFGDLSPDDNDNPDLEDLFQQFNKIIEPESKTKGSFYKEFKFLEILFKQDTYFAFPGSLTTPPFSECVTWIFCPQPFTISSRQLDLFRTLKGKNGRKLWGNDRPLQEFNGRPIITPSNPVKFKFIRDISFNNNY